MNKVMAGAAGLMGLTTLVHIFAGGPEINAPIQSSGLDPVVKAVALVVWHAVTVVLAVMAMALAYLARHENRPLALAVIGISLGFAALFLWVGFVQLGTLRPVPQWTVFALVPLLTLWGLRKA